MIRDQFTLDLATELIIDNFAGGGGASTGIELALGRHVNIAINHDPEAIALHQANHPQTQHHCESVWDIDPLKVTQGRPVGLAWFSPDCKHFSKAKGGKPRSKKIRGLAWIVIKWAAIVSPRVILLENVEEFQDWGPLLKDGLPCPRRKGKTFSSWVARLRRLGYTVEWQELRACDYGAPTIRRRLFLVARRDGKPIVWPKATHGAPDSPGVVTGKLKPWRTAAECIDWTIPCPSIFGRKRELAPATLRRIAKGIMRYVVQSGNPFIVPLTHQGADRMTKMEQPLPTVTAAHRGEMALVSPVITECANASGARVFDPAEPLRTQCAEVKGGHFALVSAFLAKHYTGVVGAPLQEPTPTVTATDHNSLVAATLVRQFGTSSAADIQAPAPTVMADGGGKTQLVEAFLIKYYGNEKEAVELKEPMHTVTARDRFGLVTVHGQKYFISDIGLRMLQPRELYRAQGFPESYIIGDKPAQGLTLTKSAQVRMCGNSVCPPMAAALVRANVPEMAAWSKTERKRISA
jgi:DNA (cytosine-5)-methyltransferase 1